MTCLKIILLACIGVFIVGAISMHHEIGYILAGVAVLIGIVVLASRGEREPGPKYHNTPLIPRPGYDSGADYSGLPSAEAYRVYRNWWDERGVRHEESAIPDWAYVLTTPADQLGPKDYLWLYSRYNEGVDNKINEDRAAIGLGPLPVKSTSAYQAEYLLGKWLSDKELDEYSKGLGEVK